MYRCALSPGDVAYIPASRTYAKLVLRPEKMTFSYVMNTKAKLAEGVQGVYTQEEGSDVVLLTPVGEQGEHSGLGLDDHQSFEVTLLRGDDGELNGGVELPAADDNVDSWLDPNYEE
jgi:hypothetical protein